MEKHMLRIISDDCSPNDVRIMSGDEDITAKIEPNSITIEMKPDDIITATINADVSLNVGVGLIKVGDCVFEPNKIDIPKKLMQTLFEEGSSNHVISTTTDDVLKELNNPNSRIGRAVRRRKM